MLSLTTDAAVLHKATVQSNQTSYRYFRYTQWLATTVTGGIPALLTQASVHLPDRAAACVFTEIAEGLKSKQ